MRQSKLIKTLKLMTKKEFRGFKNFLNSPFFNKNKKCIALYELLYPYAPNFDNEKLDDPNFNDRIYTNKRSLRTLFNEMVHLSEEYLMQLQFRKRSGIQKHFLLEELRKRGGREHFEFVYHKSLKKKEGEKKGIKKYYAEYLLEVSNLEMLYQYKTGRQITTRQLKKAIIAFDKYLISNHLWLDNAVFSAINLGTSSDAINSTTKDIVLNSKLFAEFSNQPAYKDEALINLHYLLRQLHLSKSEEDFTSLFDKLKDTHSSIHKEDHNHFYKFVANYCIEQIMQGNISYYNELLDVYLFSIKTEAFIEGNFLEPNRMRNLIITSVKSGKIELAHDLLDQHIQLVNPRYQSVTENYCRGYLYFQQGKYNLASEYIGKCIASKTLFELDGHTIFYKIYYETNQNWAFEIPIQSFRARLSRIGNRYPKYTIQGYINFFQILKQTYRKKEDPNYKKSTESIIQRMDTMKYLSDKLWLREKLHELE